MARDEHDRKSLLDELTALSPRVQLAVGDRTILIGFRSNGAVSIYFGQDFVVGFNAQHEVRRVFLHGSLFRSENGRRVTQMDRHREAGRSELRSHALTDSAQSELQSIIRWHIEMLARALAGDRFHVTGCIPEGDSSITLASIRAELHRILDAGTVFSDGM